MEENNLIDVNYFGKIKSKYGLDEVINKVSNWIKRQKLSKIWTVEKESNGIIIKFNDSVSDNFRIEVNVKNEFKGYIKINHNQNLGSSTLDKLIDMIFSIKAVFKEVNFSDDYSICENIFQEKRINIKIKELSNEDIVKIKNIYDSGFEDYKTLILEYIAQCMNLKSYKDLYINPTVKGKGYIIENQRDNYMFKFMTFLYECTTYKDTGRFCNNEFWIHQDLCAQAYDLVAFSDGMAKLVTGYETKNGYSFGVKDAHIQRLYKEKILPMLKQEKDTFNQCIIAYKFFISILEYTGFTLVGKN